MPVIKNFGHFWSRDAVIWGRRGLTGSLYGFRNVKGDPLFTDFREQIGIYALFGEGRKVVYIGQVGSGEQSLFARLKQHAQGPMRARWTNFSWFGFRGVNAGVQSGEERSLSKKHTNENKNTVPSREALSEFEAIMLQMLEPALNKQGPRWGSAEEYDQYVPWEWGEDEKDLPFSWQNQILLNRVAELEASIKKLKVTQ